MEKSSFFNSVNHDRVYNADDFSDYLTPFFASGVFIKEGNALQVIANNDMSVTVNPGLAFIKGKMYENTDNLTLKIDNADGVLNRVDNVVIQLDYLGRLVNTKIIKGEFSSVATSPALKRNNDFFELLLAKVSVNNGITKVTQSMITDMRLDDSVCGIVHNPLEHIDTHTLYLQIQADLAEFKNVSEEDFLLWFDNIKGKLGEDIAGNLLNLIETHNHDERYHLKDGDLNINGNVKATGSVNSDGGFYKGSSYIQPMSKVNGYWGFPEIGDYIRTPVSGLLPYQQGGSGMVGTSSWPFNAVYANNLYKGGVSIPNINETPTITVSNGWDIWKFPSGAMMQMKQISVSVISNKTWGNLLWGDVPRPDNFPVAFIGDVPKVFLETIGSQGYGVIGVKAYAPTTANAFGAYNGYIMTSVTTPTITITYKILAIGRWK